MGVLVQKNSGSAFEAAKAIDTGDGFIRVEGCRDGSTGIIPKSDVQSVHGPVEDVKAPSK